MKKAIITGITGQDGSYLAELLLSKNYKVYGFVRRESFENANKSFKNIQHIKNDISIIPVSITDPLNIYRQISMIKPDELYHLAAHSFVSYDMSDEINIMNINFNSTLYLANSLKEISPNCKFFFAGSSEMFGELDQTPQNEDCPFRPRSTYGLAKVCAHESLKFCRLRRQCISTIG